MNRSTYLPGSIFQSSNKSAIKSAFITFILFGLLLAFSGCVSGRRNAVLPANPEETYVDLSSKRIIGQTFIAEYAGFDEFTIRLADSGLLKGDITMHLRNSPDSQIDLLTSQQSIEQNPSSNLMHFSFSAQPRSSLQYYYAFFEVVDSDVVLPIAVDSYLAYDNGALYVNHTAQDDSVLSFELGYNPVYKIIDLIREAIQGLRKVFISCLVFIIPGWALLIYIPAYKDLSWGKILGLSIGFSFAAYPLLFLWANVFGLKLDVISIWFIVIISSMLICIHYRLWDFKALYAKIRQRRRDLLSHGNLVYAFVICLLVVSRLIPIRQTEVALWGDSVQHTTIVQLLYDNHGLFDSWLPYTPYKSMTMHFGFHILATVFGWTAGLGAPQATLFVGQLINIMAVLAIYPLAYRLSQGNQWAGILAVMTAGLFSPMPAYYVNWGRYPQLAGLAILPVAIWTYISIDDSTKHTIHTLIASGFTLAGMILSYYRIPYFFAVFILFWICFQLIVKHQRSGKSWSRFIISSGQVGITAIILCIPWILRLQSGKLLNANSQPVVVASRIQNILIDYQVWADITLYVPWILLILTVCGLLWSVIKQRWSIAITGLWILGLAGLVATRLVGLPGSNYIKNFGVVISLYVPVSLIVGWFFGNLFASMTATRNHYLWVVCFILVLVCWGAVKQIKVMDPDYQMVKRPDILAMQWIRDNTPEDAVFLVEGFRNSTGNLAAGSDAGWWLPVLTNRRNTLPPQYALVSERPIEPDYTQRILDLIAVLEIYPPATPEGILALCDNAVTHIYIGQQQGTVGFGINALFTPDDITSSNVYSTLYHQDRVWIFEMDSEVCLVN